MQLGSISAPVEPLSQRAGVASPTDHGQVARQWRRVAVPHRERFREGAFYLPGVDGTFDWSWRVGAGYVHLRSLPQSDRMGLRKRADAAAAIECVAISVRRG